MGLPRNQDLTDLPSWIPNWSTDVSLPRHNSDRVDNGKKDEQSEAPPQGDPFFQDHGSKFFLVKGSIVGTIAHSAVLTRNDSTALCTQRLGIKQDFIRLSSRFRDALGLAQEPSRPHYSAANALEQAFSCTRTANSIIPDALAASSLRFWTPSSSANLSLSATL